MSLTTMKRTCHATYLNPANQYMGDFLQDYSWIQDFEADFPQKVGLKMLNSADNNSFSDLVSVYLKVFDHLTCSFKYFGGIQEFS